VKTSSKQKLIATGVVVLTLSLGYAPSVQAHGSGGGHDELLHELHHGKPVYKTKTTTLPPGAGLPGGVTKIFQGKRYQWNGLFWKQMSQGTW
jgi:hypothetical protein